MDDSIAKGQAREGGSSGSAAGQCVRSPEQQLRQTAAKTRIPGTVLAIFNLLRISQERSPEALYYPKS